MCIGVISVVDFVEGRSENIFFISSLLILTVVNEVIVGR